MTLLPSLKNTDSQSLDTIVQRGGTTSLKMAVGTTSVGGLTAPVSWQGVATHTDGETFVTSDGLVLTASVDGDGLVRKAARRGSLTDRSAAITLGATRQAVCSANLSRSYFLFVNISDTTMWINFGTNAVADEPSIPISAGGSFVMEAGWVSSERVDVICATTGKKYVAKEG